jgi:hypothetical protein
VEVTEKRKLTCTVDLLQVKLDEGENNVLHCKYSSASNEIESITAKKIVFFNP